MKILSRLTGRILQFVNTDEYTPVEGVYAPDLVFSITERYSFALPPAQSLPWSEVLDKGLRFETGKLILGETVEYIQDLVLYHNGLLITAYSTQAAEAFLIDFFQWGESSLGFRVSPSVHKKRIYLSELSVEFEQPVDETLHKLEVLIKGLERALKTTYEAHLPPVQLASLTLDYDKGASVSEFQLLAPFAIERRGNHAFTDDVFFCKAPLRTDDHIQLLETLESLLKT